VNITNKKQMYEMLRAGKFGNTVPNFATLEGWAGSSWSLSTLFGIRSGVPSGPCFLNQLPENVPAIFRDMASDGFQPNISPMVDHMRTCMINVWEASDGLRVEYVPGLNPGLTWRDAFRDSERCIVQRADGIAAHAILSNYLNPNSLTDLWELFYEYPYHVIELTTLDRCYGTYEHRNAVVWEVRNY